MRRALVIVAATAASAAAVIHFNADALSPRATENTVPVETGASAAQVPSPPAPAPQPRARERDLAKTRPASTPPASVDVLGPVVSTRWGPVQVRVVVQGGVLVDVVTVRVPDGDRKSVQINERATPVYRAQALERQSAGIDILSGATITWEGYTVSLQIALAEAGLVA